MREPRGSTRLGIGAGVLLLSAWLVPGARAAAEPAPPSRAENVPKNGALRLELLGMARDDQETILAVESGRPGDPADAAARLRGGRVHERNTARIKQIVSELGWPGRTLVGADGAHAAWLLAQHADEDPAFQRLCLEAMKEAFERGEATAWELSFLTDRVLTAEGKPQMYGTQGGGVRSPEDEARVDANRLAIGLEPWRDFVKKRQATHDAWLPQ